MNRCAIPTSLSLLLAVVASLLVGVAPPARAATGDLTVHVLDGEGAGVANTKVVVETFVEFEGTDRYEFTGSSPLVVNLPYEGDWDVSAVDLDTNDTSDTQLVSYFGGTVDPSEITLTTSPPQLAVTFLDGAGSEITDGQVTADGTSDFASTDVHPYSFDGLADGTYDVYGYDPTSDAFTPVVEVTVTGGVADPSSVTVQLVPTNLTVTFLDETDTPVTNADVYVDATDGSGHSDGAFGASPFEFALPDGTYEVSGYDYDTDYFPVPQEVVVSGGVASPSDLTLGGAVGPPVDVTVEFLDASGSPVTDGEVFADRTTCCDSAYDFGASPYTLTLTDGTWDVSGYDYVSGESSTVEQVTVADGSASPSTVQIQIPTPNLTVEYEKQDGTPVDFAEVRATPQGGCCDVYAYGESPVEMYLPDGTWDVTATDLDTGAQSAPTTVTVTDGTAVPDLVTLVRPAPDLVVDVLDAGGSPVTNGALSVLRTDACCDDYLYGSSPFELYLDDGTYELVGIDLDDGDAQTNRQAVEVTGGNPDVDAPVLQVPGPTTDVSFVDGSGAAITGATYLAHNDVGTVTVLDGSPTSLPLADGAWDVEAIDDQFGLTSQTVPVTVTGGSSSPALVELVRPDPTVLVEFLDGSGDPVASGTVFAEETTTSEYVQTSGSSPFGLVLGDGTWTIGGTDDASGLDATTVEVTVDGGTANEPAVTIQLPPPNLTVTFLDADGTPITDGIVQANEDGCCGYQEASGGSPYELTLADGTWDVSALDYDTFASTGTTTVTVTDGTATPSELTLQLPSVNVVPTLVDTSGAPVEGTVTARLVSDCCETVDAYSDPYELALFDGQWEITGRDPSTGGVTDPVLVTVDGGTPDLATPELVVPDPNVTVQLRDHLGDPVTGGRIVAEGPGYIVLGGDSPFELALANGTWTLSGEDPSTGASTGAAAVTVTVTDGVADPAVVVLDLPAPNVSVSFLDGAGAHVTNGEITAVRTDTCCDEIWVQAASPVDLFLADGTWELTGLDYRDYTSSSTATVTVSGGVADPAEVTLRLPSPNLDVSFVDADGVPVRNFEIEADPQDTCCSIYEYDDNPTTLALADGTWELTGRSYDDAALSDTITVEVVDGIASPSSIQLAVPAPNVTVELVDSADVPVADGRIRYRRTDRFGSLSQFTNLADLALSDGTWEIWGEDEATGGRTDVALVTVDGGTPTQALVTLVTPDANLPVEFQDADGTPINGTVLAETTTCCDHLQVDVDGSGALALPDGTWEVFGLAADGQGRTSTTLVTVSGGTPDVTPLVLQLPADNLAVEFTDSTDTPITNALVTAELVSDCCWDVTTVGTSPFDIALFDGTWEVVAEDLDTGGTTAPVIVTVEDGTADQPLLQLVRPDVNVTVQFVDAGGSPVTDSTVFAEAQDCCEYLQFDGAGEYSLALSDGEWRIGGSTPDMLGPPAPQVVTVTGGTADPAVVTLRLPDVNVTPTFVDSSSNPITSGRVTAALQSGCCSLVHDFGDPFELALHDGTWELTAYDQSTDIGTDPITVEVVDGVATPSAPELVRPDPNITIEVLDADGSALGSNVEVRAERSTCCEVSFLYGSAPFETLLGDGTWELSAYDYDTGSSTPAVTVEVTDGTPNQPTVTLRLPADNLTVEFEQEDGTPVANGRIVAERREGGERVERFGTGPFQLGLIDGTWDVTGTDEDTSATTDPVTVTVTGGTADPAVVNLVAPAPNVTVRVVDTSDTDLSPVTVIASRSTCCESVYVSGGSPLELHLGEGNWDVRAYEAGNTIEIPVQGVSVSGGTADPATVTLVRPDPNVTASLLDSGGSAVDDGFVVARLTSDSETVEEVFGSPYHLLLADGEWELVGYDASGALASDPVTVSVGGGTPDEGNPVLQLPVNENAPDTTIDAGPVGTVGSADATFEFTSDDATATFECQLDAGGWSPCTSPEELLGLADGEHTFEVRASNGDGTDATPASRTWTIDTTAPETTIDTGPDGTTTGPATSFAFSSADGTATFECRLDGGGWDPCTSPEELTSLAEGEHTFEVRATDEVDNTDATPASRTWTVDATAPDTEITAGPTGTVATDGATFEFTSADGTATFECRLDAAGWAPCTSPEELTSLAEGEHTFEVRATDDVGNTDATPASRTWTVDTAPPETTIDTGPDGTTTGPDVTFEFSSNEAGSTFECQLDAGGWTSCASPLDLTGLADGEHTFEVQAVDAGSSVDPTPASRTWTVDATAPDTEITAGPTGTVATDGATFEFTSADGTATFECQLDAGGWDPCTSPEELTGLAEGEHTFEVRAVDPVGNTDPTPASATWIVDTTAPVTTITAGPEGPTASADATFEFSADEPATFECRLDAGGWASCTSPEELAGLADGEHTLEVRATDGASNIEATPASRTWTIDTAVPDTTIDAAPSGTVTSTTAQVEFSSDDVEATFTCRLDGGDWAPCTSPAELTGLADGEHTFEVRAVDAAGNTDATPGSATWTVDATAPGATITAGPSGSTQATAAEFEFTSGDAGATYECRLDGGSWTGCTSPTSHTGLGDGAHTFEVRGTDEFGNTDTTPASRTWTVDTTAPQTTITSAPGSLIATSTAKVGFRSSEGGSFQCRVDSGSWTTCASPASFSGLGDGAHTVAVRAVDAAGNVDPSPATTSFTVDTTAPSTSITSGPSGTVETDAASFAFTSSDGSATFQCRLDSGSWTACTSPVGYSGLADATHTFRVRAVDAAGNVDASPATRSWTVDAVPDVAPDPGFTDDDDTVFTKDIAKLAAAGITKGCNPPDNTRFCPADDVTRGQMAAFLVRGLGLPDSPRDYFRDDDGNVFEDDINALAHAGITAGCNPPANDRYCPGDKVSRGAMAAFLSRALGLPRASRDYFRDDNGSVFERDINKLAAAGITAGCNPPTNDRYCPGDSVTRGQMAAFLSRALGL